MKKTMKKAALSAIFLWTRIAPLLVALTSCASMGLVPEPLPPQPALETRTQETLRGVVRVARVRSDCGEQERRMKHAVSDAFAASGAPSPERIAIRPLSGSTLCGVPDETLGSAGNLPQAEVSAYWPAISRSEFRKAAQVLSSMNPIR